MMDKIIKIIPKVYNFHAKSFKFVFFSEFRVVNRLWLLVLGLWQFLPLDVIADRHSVKTERNLLPME